jgi:hypothetical protein
MKNSLKVISGEIIYFGTQQSQTWHDLAFHLCICNSHLVVILLLINNITSPLIGYWKDQSYNYDTSSPSQ